MKTIPTVVINVVGLSGKLLGSNTPNLNSLMRQGGHCPLFSITPAVTCSVQSTFLTGELPSQHGIVANGWYFRDLCQVWFWRQSNKLVQAEKVWEKARRLSPGFTCGNMFWWYNMYSSVDISATPRPMYPADGRKIPDVYTEPAQLRRQLTEKLGQFPLFNFWGPNTQLWASEWIKEASIDVAREHNPDLLLVYLPHLDYNLQRLGPDHPKVQEDLKEVDQICGELIKEFTGKRRIIVLSEYHIYPVKQAVMINQALRSEGWIRIREELGLEQFDAGASRAFAVTDHQLAHIYVKEEKDIAKVKQCVEELPAVAKVWQRQELAEIGLDHPRSGELVAISDKDSWFSYYYWLDDQKAPDYARTVDIHRKPGFDPVELFIDPKIRFPKLKAMGKLLWKKLGGRTLFDFIPLDPSLVKGSHGVVSSKPEENPVFISSEADLLDQQQLAAQQVQGMILRHLFPEYKPE